MLDTTLNTLHDIRPSAARRLRLQPAAAGATPANPFAPAISDIAEALVREAPGHAESRRPAPAQAPAAAYGLD